MTAALRRDWYTRKIEASDLTAAGIYLWTIAGVGVYVGQARTLRRRLRQYPNNVRRLLAGLPYHVKALDYRRVHHALADAYKAGTLVTLSVLEICEPGALNERERCWIDHFRAKADGGDLPVLNSN